MKDLEQIRTEIDKIDDGISELFLERMNLAKEVAESKKESGKMINDATRETKILYRLSQKTPEEYKLYLKELYSTMFSVSKSYQQRLISTKSPTVEKLEKALDGESAKLPFNATVACQGVEGANSGTAARKFFSVCDVNYFKTFESVFSAVDKGFCEYGVLPIENSTAGSVLEVYDLMKKYSFYIVGSVRVKINHCLVGLPTAEKKDVKKVISHQQALSQCAQYIQNNKWDMQPVENTAVAAKWIAENGDKSVVALCSRECAELYGLKILEENVQDNSGNYTRFILISKDLKVYGGSDRISVMTSTAHEVGSLSKLLTRFSSLGLNLSKIESRPLPNSDFEFLFYLDFMGDIRDKGVLNLIAELDNSSIRFTFLGAYKESI